MKKALIIGIVLLIVATCIVAAVHLRNQDVIPCMVIQQEGRQIAVSFDDLNKSAFSGELIDGKGDVSSHDCTGILLRELLEEKGIDLARLSGVTVTSADNYTATFSAQEILQTDTVYVAIAADGKRLDSIDGKSDGVQIIVFGDPNSRRCVRFAQKITIT